MPSAGMHFPDTLRHENMIERRLAVCYDVHDFRVSTDTNKNGAGNSYETQLQNNSRLAAPAPLKATSGSPGSYHSDILL